MSRVIIFCGQSGSGKTTLALEVSQQLNIFLLSKDALKERLYELESGKTLEDSNRIGKMSVFLMLDLAEDSIKNGVDIILESPFNHLDNLKRFHSWVERYGVDVQVIICEIDEIERKKRIEMRPRHYSHHDVTRKVLGHFVKDNFDYSTFPGNKLFLDTSQPLEKLVEQTLEFLRTERK